MKNTLKVTGTAYWASVHTPSTYTIGSDVITSYNIKVSVTDKAVLQTLKDLGVQIKSTSELTTKEGDSILAKGDTAKHYITAKARRAPLVVDAKKKELSPTTAVGNGSTVNIYVSTYKDKIKPKVQHLGLQAVQVTKLVEYNAGISLDDLDEEEGYVTTTQKVSEEDEIERAENELLLQLDDSDESF